jgi:hypothetical protein
MICTPTLLELGAATSSGLDSVLDRFHCYIGSFWICDGFPSDQNEQYLQDGHPKYSDQYDTTFFRESTSWTTEQD